MLFNGFDNNCLGQALQYITALIAHGKVFRIVDLSGISKSQRGLLHVYCGIVAQEFGIPMDDVKRLYYKAEVNPDVFCFTYYDKKQDEWRVGYRSSESLPKEVISYTLERFKNWALIEHNITLPDRNDQQAINQAYVAVDKYNRTFGYGTK